MVARELLWRAWPLGYLPMRGCATVSGHICVVVPSERHPLGVWDGPDLCNESNVRDYARRGDLLPDPTHYTTRACILADIAESTDARWVPRGFPALSVENGLSLAPCSNTYHVLSDGHTRVQWQCQNESHDVIKRNGCYYPPHCADPAEMLVWIRVVERLS